MHPKKIPMKYDPAKIQLLRMAVEQKFGSSLGAPSDFDRLSVAIEATVGLHIGVSTLKRIWGYVKSPHTPTFATLSLLCRYIGHRDWAAFCSGIRNMDNTEHDSGFSTVSVVLLTDEPVGSTFRLRWSGGKGCVIRKVSFPGRFEILEANNLKLISGDTISLDTIAVGQSMFAGDCRRGDRELGTYVGARAGGIQSIERISR